MLRQFPHPFRAALTICSDIDGTDTVEKFLAIQSFLNTERDTDMGPGIGLEIGNSFFPLIHNDTFSYLSSRPTDRAVIRDLIKAGYIDCMHSYGYGVNSRRQVIRVLDALEQDGCKIPVWVNHSGAETNLGPDPSPGLGDVVGSPAYHADITLAHGVRFAWMGRGTNLVGQEAPITVRALARIYDPAHRRPTAQDTLREILKIALAKAGSRRYAIHRHNRLIELAHLRDGRPVYEFNRCHNHWNKPRPDSTRLPYMLRPEVLQALKAVQGYMIAYTHLGMNTHSRPYFSPPVQAALRRLAEEYRAGEIYVTTTSRLLTMCLTQRLLDWSCQPVSEHGVKITIHRINDRLSGPRLPTLDELQGIAFYVPDRRQASIFLGDKEITRVERNPRDHTGRESVMIARTFLTYPLSSDLKDGVNLS